MSCPIMITRIDFASGSNGYASLHSLKLIDSSDRIITPQNFKFTATGDYRKATFSAKGIDGHIIQDTHRTSATTSDYANISHLFNYTTPAEFEMNKLVIIFAKPILLTGLTVRGACDSTSTQKTFTIKVSPYPTWGTISSGTISPAKVDGSKPASYSTHSLMFTKMPIIKAYKVPETGITEQKYLFLMPQNQD